MYRFVKGGGGGGGSSSGAPGGVSRLFVQGTREGGDRDDVNGAAPATEMSGIQDLRAVHRFRRLDAEVEGSNLETTRTARRPGGGRSVTTRVLRKTTTLTRGEERTVTESLLQRAGEGKLVHVTERVVLAPSTHPVTTKRAKVYVAGILCVHTHKQLIYDIPLAPWTSRDKCQNQQIESVPATGVLKPSFLLASPACLWFGVSELGSPASRPAHLSPQACKCLPSPLLPPYSPLLPPYSPLSPPYSPLSPVSRLVLRVGGRSWTGSAVYLCPLYNVKLSGTVDAEPLVHFTCPPIPQYFHSINLPCWEDNAPQCPGGLSDIVVGQEPNVSAREVLLRWARRSTSKYPGVRVADFTSSWKDGMAFNALIHRNRPDLIDWRTIRTRMVRERLETAFSIAEREYGVTRLLDPEGVTRTLPEMTLLLHWISLLRELHGYYWETALSFSRSRVINLPSNIRQVWQRWLVEVASSSLPQHTTFRHN
uniref:Calponin-homology (CH) domain-containing protein n=1 Tax=Timema bartmani TaxID=61472 RepID=A0A7R9EU78_9NEOP|nr:unnamed protein product [Timema bartmani]